LHVRVCYGYIVDGFNVRSGAQVLDAGGETFCARKQEVVGERFVVFEGVGSGGETFGRC